MANGAFNKAKYLIATGALNLATADLRGILVTPTYTFSPDPHGRSRGQTDGARHHQHHHPDGPADYGNGANVAPGG